MREGLLLRLSPAFAAAAMLSCSAPRTLSRTRSPLLDAPSVAMTPEARPASAPSGGTGGSRFDEPRSSEDDGAAIAASARRRLGQTAIEADGRRFPSDCTGLVRAVYAEHGIDLLADAAAHGENAVTAIYRFATRHGSVRERDPAPGDLVFFRETYDRNRDGRRNDGLTHVGIVDAVEPDGTVYVIHRVARGVVRYRMDLRHPDRHEDTAGHVLNDYLRTGKEKRLAGELCAGFGTIVRR